MRAKDLPTSQTTGSYGPRRLARPENSTIERTKRSIMNRDVRRFLAIALGLIATVLLLISAYDRYAAFEVSHQNADLGWCAVLAVCALLSMRNVAARYRKP